MKNLDISAHQFSPRLAGLALIAAVSLASWGCGNVDDQSVDYDTRQLAVGGDYYHDGVNDDGDWIKVCDNNPALDDWNESTGTLEGWEEWVMDCMNGGAAPPPGDVGVIYECSTTSEVMVNKGDRTALRVFQGECKERNEGTVDKRIVNLWPAYEVVGRTGRDSSRLDAAQVGLKRDDSFDAWGSKVYICDGTNATMLASRGVIAVEYFESKCRHAGGTVVTGTVEQGDAPAPKGRGMTGRGDVADGPGDHILKEIDRGNKNGRVWYKCVGTGDVMWHSEGIHAYNDFVAACNEAGGTIHTGYTWYTEHYISTDSAF